MSTSAVHRPVPSHRHRTRSLLGAGGLFLAGWAAVLAMVLTHEGAAEDDAPVLRWMIGHRSGAWTGLMETVSSATLTNGVIIATVLVLIIVGATRRSWWPAVTIGGSLGIAAVTSVTIKSVVERQRPAIATMLGPPETGWGFPSGHTLLTTALVGAVALVVWRTSIPLLARVLSVVAAISAAGLMGASRLYLGVHWLTDVLASYALAGAILLAVAALTAPGTARDRWTSSLRSRVRRPR